MREPKTRIITVEIPSDIYEKIQLRRKREGVTMNFQVNSILKNHFENTQYRNCNKAGDADKSV